MTYADLFISRLKNREVDEHLRQTAHDSLPQQNVVSTGDLGALEIDIHAFAKTRPYAYVPKNFEAVVVRVVNRQPTTLLLFRTGKVVVVGSKSPEQTIEAIHRLRHDLESERIMTSMCTFKIVNEVYVTKIPGVIGIDIARIHRDHMEDSSWTPSVFPGLRLLKGGILIRIFDTNRIVIMAVTDPSQVKAIMTQLANLCTRYRSDYMPLQQQRFKYRIMRHTEVFGDMPMTTHNRT